MSKRKSTLNVAEAAAFLNVSAPRIYQFASKKRIGRKVDGAWVFTKQELQAFLAQPRRRGRPKEKSINRP